MNCVWEVQILCCELVFCGLIMCINPGHKFLVVFVLEQGPNLKLNKISHGKKAHCELDLFEDMLMQSQCILGKFPIHPALVNMHNLTLCAHTPV